MFYYATNNVEQLWHPENEQVFPIECSQKQKLHGDRKQLSILTKMAVDVEWLLAEKLWQQECSL